MQKLVKMKTKKLTVASAWSRKKPIASSKRCASGAGGFITQKQKKTSCKNKIHKN